MAHRGGGSQRTPPDYRTKHKHPAGRASGSHAIGTGCVLGHKNFVKHLMPRNLLLLIIKYVPDISLFRIVPLEPKPHHAILGCVTVCAKRDNLTGTKAVIEEQVIKPNSVSLTFSKWT